VIGGSEVERDSGLKLNVRIAMELGAVVEGDSAEVSVEVLDGLSHRPIRLVHVSRNELFDNSETGDALDERENAVSLVGADDGVALPMSGLSTPLDDGGPFTDMSFSDDSAACLRASALFSAELGDDAEISPEFATAFTVETKVAIDGLGTHALLGKGVCAANNLSGTPFVLNVFDDRRPVLRGVVEVSPRAAAPGSGVLLSLLRPIGAIVSGSVAFELTNDGGGMSVEEPSDLSFGMPLAEQSSDGVSFIFGELVVSHVVTPILAEEDAGSITGSPSSRDRGVALSLADRDA
jgi:hypothetical protein